MLFSLFSSSHLYNSKANKSGKFTETFIRIFIHNFVEGFFSMNLVTFVMHYINKFHFFNCNKLIKFLMPSPPLQPYTNQFRNIFLQPKANFVIFVPIND